MVLAAEMCLTSRVPCGAHGTFGQQLRGISMAIAMRFARRLVKAVAPESTWGTDVRRFGDFFSFSERGFVAHDSPAELLYRNYYEQGELRRLLRGAQIERSLEIGCGFGRLSPVIAEYSSKHIAIDINPDGLALARRYYPQVEFALTSGTALAFPADHFDAIITWTVLQHIPSHRIEAATAEIVRVARPGSRVILLEASRYHGQKLRRGAHTFDRHPSTYEKLLSPLRLIEQKWIEGIHVHHPYSPGQLLVFQK